jgi:hypothetical protein
LVRAELRAQALARGGDGKLRDLAVFLCEDGLHVMIFADYTSSDDSPMAVLKLDGQISEDAFDPAGIAQYLHDDQVMH